jgi:hypothetical protein
MERLLNENDVYALFMPSGTARLRVADVDVLPRVEVKEVVHGRWENITGGMITLGDCSECKTRQPVLGTNYCKNCGAKMGT